MKTVKNEKEKVLRQMPAIPLRGITIFPNMVLHFDVGREKSIKALEEAMITDQTIFLTTQKSAETDLPTPEDYYWVGTVARIKQMLKMPGEVVRVLVEGVCRASIEEIIHETPYLRCLLLEHPETDQGVDSNQLEAMSRALLEAFDEYVAINPKLSAEMFASVDSVQPPSRMADLIASNLEVKNEQKQEILECYDPLERMEKVTRLLIRETEIQKIERDISMKVRGQINKGQKEYYLREQLRAIQEELGQDENVEEEVEAYRKKLKALKLPKELHEKVEHEIQRFYKVQPSSAEGGVIRTYLDWVLELPWNKQTRDSLDLKEAARVLNEDHYGLEKVKERILEYLAVRKLSKDMKGPILCFVGPPGVGKTSVAKSIARAMNRKFVRMSLGGVRDEAEIRGHRRTYIGAIPGRVMGAMKDAKSNNPVFLFDEIDKVGNDYRGDPASALLEVLDPEQNKEFTDHFIDLPFDLSRVMFLTTANTTETIPMPLLDRMEVIEISGYTEEEKLRIAQRYLIPKKLEEHGLKLQQLKFSPQAIRDMINYYTRESGVRNLEREIANVCRKAAKKIVEDQTAHLKVTPSNLEKYLGRKRFHYDTVGEENQVGVTNGLAWTIVGGDTLSIETTVMEGNGKLVLTGQLGEVMQESAKAGISYIRANSEKLGVDGNFYREKDVHIHIPEGAIPKDGPSAGVTMCTSVISALTGIPVRKDLAMTGEITLRGKVLAVGGIKEKVLAAHRAGMKKVLLPMENQRDIQDIPANVRKELEFVLISHMDQVLKQALVRG